MSKKKLTAIAEEITSDLEANPEDYIGYIGLAYRFDDETVLAKLKETVSLFKDETVKLVEKETNPGELFTYSDSRNSVRLIEIRQSGRLLGRLFLESSTDYHGWIYVVSPQDELIGYKLLLDRSGEGWFVKRY